MVDLHFDPLNALLLVGAMIGGSIAYIKKGSKQEIDAAWHGEWIKKHDAECDQREKNYLAMFSEIKQSNVHLATLADATSKRVDRLEDRMDSQ